MQPQKYQTTSKSDSKFVIVDGNALLHRAYHAYPHTLRTSKGELVNAVYGFSRLMLTLINDLKPNYLTIAFDTAAPTFRHLDYVGYKAHRPKMEDELASQLDLLGKLVRAMKVKSYAIEGFEADDVIGTLVEKVGNTSIEVDTYIVTGDMDALQLISNNTFVYSPNKGLSHPKIWKNEDVFAKFGFGPDLVVDYKALRGDPSDNIPGVKGVGDKTATELIKTWGSLESIYRNIDKITPPKLANKLALEFEMASLSKNLALIRRDVPLRLSLKECSFAGFSDNNKLLDFFEEMEFLSLVKYISSTRIANQEEKDDNQLTLGV